MNGLQKLAELSDYLTNLESELSQFWQLSSSLLCLIKESNFVKVNPAWTKVLGYTSEEMRNTSFYDYIHPDDLAETSNAHTQLKDDGSLLSFKNRYRHKDGSYVYLDWSVSHDSLHDTIYGVAKDVTKEIKLEENLKLQQKAIEHNAHSMIITEADKEKDFAIVSANKAFELLSGYTTDEIIGKNCMFLQGDKQENKDTKTINRMKECMNNHEQFDGILSNYKKNGEHFYNKIRISPLFNDKNICTHFIGSQYDATKEIEQVKKLIESQTKLNSVLDMLPIGVFLADKNGNKTYANKKWKDIIGIDNIEESDWKTGLASDEIENIQACWDKFIHDKEHYEIKHKFINVKTDIEKTYTVKANFLNENTIVGFVEENF